MDFVTASDSLGTAQHNYGFMKSSSDVFVASAGVEPGFSPGSLSSVAVVDNSTITATFSSGVLATTIDDPTDWTLSGLGFKLQVNKAVAAATDSIGVTQTTLSVYPSLYPGHTFTLTATNAAHSNGIAVTPKFVTFTVATSLAPVRPTGSPAETFPIGMLDALTLAFGEVCQKFYGRPTTKLVEDSAKDATYLLVESTLAFPDEGSVFARGRRATYTGKTDASLTGVVFDIPRNEAMPYGAEVALDVRSILPD